MKNILIACALFAGIQARAQINVGSSALAQMNKAGRLSDDNIKELKNTTTLFVLQQKDYEHIGDFQKTISEVWKLSKFKIIKPDEIEQYAGKGGFSFFSFGGYYTERTHGAAQVESLFTVHLSYDLWIPEVSKRGKVKVGQYFARILLSQDANIITDTRHNYYSARFKDNMIQYIYDDAVFNNWGAGFLKGYLLSVNGLLMEGETRGRFTSDEDDKNLAGLKNDTLYIPDYINTHFSPMTAAEKDGDKDEENIGEVYTHPFKIITAPQLNAILINNNKPLYYLVYVRSAADKFVNVYHSDKGQVFSRYTPMSYNFKYKDLSKIENQLR